MAVSCKEVGAALIKFVARHCVNGGPMIKGLHFDFSASPTVSYPALRTMIALAAAYNLTLASLDVTNCFQLKIFLAILFGFYHLEKILQNNYDKYMYKRQKQTNKNK